MDGYVFGLTGEQFSKLTVTTGKAPPPFLPIPSSWPPGIVIVDSEQPGNPQKNQLWWDSDTEVISRYDVDTGSFNPAAGGTGGPSGIIRSF